MKALKGRKHPTCSRCRFHGKKDVRVLQHVCPFKNCTCSSCFLIKRRSIIYRAQKNLDKQESDDNSSDLPGCNGPKGELLDIEIPMVNQEGSCDGITGHSGTTHALTPNQPQAMNPLYAANNHNNSSTYSQSSNFNSLSKQASDHKSADFHTLCLTFPDLQPSQLQSIFEETGNDFHRAIDRILMSKWFDTADFASDSQGESPESIKTESGLEENSCSGKLSCDSIDGVLLEESSNESFIPNQPTYSQQQQYNYDSGFQMINPHPHYQFPSQYSQDFELQHVQQQPQA